MNTSRAMGGVLLALAVLLAGFVGTHPSPLVLVVGFLAVVALFYMGIGLYSRGLTPKGVLRDTDKTHKNAAMYRTASYLSAGAAVGGVVGFAMVTLGEGEMLYKAVFALVFLYNLPASLWLWHNSRSPIAD